MSRWWHGHINIGRRVTIYGDNAMHFAVNVWTHRWGYICFRPSTRRHGHWNRWYFYVSPNATPWAATWGCGPGFNR